VRLIEDTPREKLLEEVAARIKKGLSYREVLAGLLLAGVRNVQPRPSVGFKFHAVLVVKLGAPSGARRSRQGAGGCRCSGRSTASKAHRPRT